MTDQTDEQTFEFLSADSVAQLSSKKRSLYADRWSDLLEFLRTEGKEPERNRGYAQSNLRPVARRIHQLHEYCWENCNSFLDISTADADQVIKDLNEDKFVTRTGDPYSEASKRKFSDALSTYFRFAGETWEPEIQFGANTGASEESSDPFTLAERSQLMDASLEYRAPPCYSNLSPEERDRWKGYIAQLNGKKKESVTMEDWEQLQDDWKIPSLVSVALDLGARPKLIERLVVSTLDLDNKTVVIPGEIAVKNDQKWKSGLSERSATLLKKWLDQRDKDTDYDDSDRIWLNRKGNPYNSKSLNNILDSLLELGGISTQCRKLTWYSIRHSTGRYVYNSEKDIEMVAEVLRQASLSSARRYLHPTPETKQEVIESIQGQDQL